MSIDLTRSIVRVLQKNRSTAGTGFVASKEGLIATCSHVVQSVESQKQGNHRPDHVDLVFHITGDCCRAKIEWWRPYDKEDVAILRLECPLPEGAEPLPLGFSGGTSRHEFTTFGYPDEDGMYGDGRIVDLTKRRGRMVLQLNSTTVTSGFSGAPIWDIKTRRVVGMATSITTPDRYGRLTETAFITPSETLQTICPGVQLSAFCPYRSLDFFTEDYAEFFFGREKHVIKVIEKLRCEPRFLAVFGPSGSGKSSLIRAGLIPQLKQGKILDSEYWKIIIIRPADNPFNQLAAHGLSDGYKDLTTAVKEWLEQHKEYKKLMLVVDQFEELFAICLEHLRQAFVKQLTKLLEAHLPITIVLVMRNDFYPNFDMHAPNLIEWVERSMVNIPRTLEKEEMRKIILCPAENLGLRFEEGLIETIVNDAMRTAPISEEEGQIGRSAVLPLLEFALYKLWEKDHKKGILTYETYNLIGGVKAAIREQANSVFNSLEKGVWPLVRRIFTVDLVNPGEKSEGQPAIKRRVPLDSLIKNENEREAVYKVVKLLADARLLVTDENTVEIAHEALLNEWDELRDWLKESRDFMLWHEEIARRVQTWVRTNPIDPANRKLEEPLRGSKLEKAEEWLQKREADLNQEERDFIVACRQQEQRWKELYEELQTLDKMKDELISNVTHEFKTPLISIRGYGELIYDEKLGGLSDTQKKSIEAIIRNADRLTKLVNSLLFISRLKYGKIEFHFEPLDLDEIVKICVSDFKFMIEKKKIILEKDIHAISRVIGDKDTLIEVITSLLDNAIKFTPDGGKILIKAWSEDESIHFIIADNGIGIPSDVIPKLFTPFYQVDASAKTYSGTGLGLYIAKKIIDAFRGKIWIESEVGKGTTVHIILPIAKDKLLS